MRKKINERELNEPIRINGFIREQIKGLSMRAWDNKLETKWMTEWIKDQ